MGNSSSSSWAQQPALNAGHRVCEQRERRERPLGLSAAGEPRGMETMNGSAGGERGKGSRYHPAEPGHACSNKYRTVDTVVVMAVYTGGQV